MPKYLQLKDAGDILNSRKPKGTIRPGNRLLYVTKSHRPFWQWGFIVIHFIVQIKIDEEGQK